MRKFCKKQKNVKLYELILPSVNFCDTLFKIIQNSKNDSFWKA